MAEKQTTTSAAFIATLKRDLLIAFKKKNDIVNPFMFFIIVVSLFPIGISPESDRLTEIAAGVIWISVLLASMLSMDNLYRSDYEDGSLEQLLLSPHPLFFLVLAKNISHWLVSGLPVVLVSPILAYMLALPTEAYGTLGVISVAGHSHYEPSWINCSGAHCWLGKSRSNIGCHYLADERAGTNFWNSGRSIHSK